MSYCRQDYCKSDQSISLIVGVVIGATNRKNSLILVVIRSQIHNPGQFSIYLTIVESGILGDLIPFVTQSLISLYEMNAADKVLSPQHFGRDLAVIQIRIN